MHLSLLNLYSAAAIGIIIFAMASIREVRTKALLYVLPIPISIGIIATHGIITASNVLGLVLTCLFLIGIRTLVDIYHVPIITADILACIAYVGLGYVLIKLVHLPFIVMSMLYLALWAVVTWWMHTHQVSDTPSKPSALPPSTKGAIAGGISFGIYSFKDLLAGIVVTFPYNGVFAVIEVQHHLNVFVRSVIRNTIAITGLFATMYYLHAQLPLLLNLLAGWIAFGIILRFSQRITV